MNYYRPLEIIKEGKASGKYHYTVTNDGVSLPTGYCASECPGHDTPEEARLHFKEYLLDHASFDGKIMQKHQCELCENYTDRVSQIPAHYIIHSLCDKHCNREGLKQILKVGDMAQS